MLQHTYWKIKQTFQEVFDHPISEKDDGEILTLGWNKPALKIAFCWDPPGCAFSDVQSFPWIVENCWKLKVLVILSTQIVSCQIKIQTNIGRTYKLTKEERVHCTWEGSYNMAHSIFLVLKIAKWSSLHQLCCSHDHVGLGNSKAIRNPLRSLKQVPQPWMVALKERETLRSALSYNDTITIKLYCYLHQSSTYWSFHSWSQSLHNTQLCSASPVSPHITSLYGSETMRDFYFETRGYGERVAFRSSSRNAFCFHRGAGVNRLILCPCGRQNGGNYSTLLLLV